VEKIPVEKSAFHTQLSNRLRTSGPRLPDRVIIPPEALVQRLTASYAQALGAINIIIASIFRKRDFLPFYRFCIGVWLEIDLTARFH
jgi:hypothetical protein